MILSYLAEAMALADKVKHLFVASADARGIPHLAIAERLVLANEDVVTVTAWFCPKTAENVDENANVSLVIWDRERDAGYQLVGQVEQMLDLAMLNGFLPEETEAVQQIERKLVIRIRHVLHFSHGHHSDTDLE